MASSNLAMKKSFPFQTRISLFLSAVDLGPKSISQYEIVNWDYAIKNMSGSKELNVLSLTVNLKYRFFSIFMVTYLPTILINIINQATNYITGDSKYDLIITVNITSMMVLASIYLSVSTSLPNTQSIKPVEEWLLFNLAYPFLVILVNVVLQVNQHFRKIGFLIFFFQNKVELVSGLKRDTNVYEDLRDRKTMILTLKTLAYIINPSSYIIFCVIYFLQHLL